MKIENHYQRAITLLASQFLRETEKSELSNFNKLIKSLVSELQLLDDVNDQLKNQRWMTSSYGQQLDEIGEILGLPRNENESDKDYLERLQFQIFINTSKGTPEEIMQILQFLTEASYVGYFEREHGFFQLETNGLKFPDPPNDLNDAIKRVSPAGVNYAPIIATYNVKIPFDLSDDLQNSPLFLKKAGAPASNFKADPYGKNIYVSVGGTIDAETTGGLAELNYSKTEAGQLSELIQKNGNLLPGSF